MNVRHFIEVDLPEALGSENVMFLTRALLSRAGELANAALACNCSTAAFWRERSSFFEIFLASATDNDSKPTMPRRAAFHDLDIIGRDEESEREWIILMVLWGTAVIYKGRTSYQYTCDLITNAPL